MRRTLSHALIALVWTVVAPYVTARYLNSAPSTPDVVVWAERLLSVMLINIAGFFVLLWSWLTHDAAVHGKPRSTALAYALASVPSCGLALVVYFYATRERKEATIAMVVFFAICCVLMSVALV